MKLIEELKAAVRELQNEHDKVPEHVFNGSEAAVLEVLFVIEKILRYGLKGFSFFFLLVVLLKVVQTSVCSV